MSDRPILYSFRRCPYAMRGRMALAISGVELEHREIVLRNKPPSMLKASPKGTVPVVVLPNGQVLEESLDVMDWALTRNDPENWLSSRKSLQSLIENNDGPFKHHLDRYKYANRYEGTDSVTHRDGASIYLEALNRQLEGRENLAGPTRSFADIAIFPFIRQFANTDRDWFDQQNWPHLQAWLARHLASDLFAGIMKKHALWEDPAWAGLET